MSTPPYSAHEEQIMRSHYPHWKAAEVARALGRSDRPSYAAMLAFSKAQADAFGHAAAEVEDGTECVGCTD